jgi:methyl-accepting chemotaxis protein
MNNLTIRSKILAAAILLSAASIVLGFYNLRQTGLVNEKAAEIRDNWLPSVARLGALNTIVKTVRARQNRLSAYLAYYPDKVAEGLKQVRDTIVETDKVHETYKPFITPNSRESELAKEFATAWKRSSSCT